MRKVFRIFKLESLEWSLVPYNNEENVEKQLSVSESSILCSPLFQSRNIIPKPPSIEQNLYIDDNMEVDNIYGLKPTQKKEGHEITSMETLESRY